MKCDEPKVYKVYTTRNEGAFGFCEGADPTDIELEHESVCLKSDVDKVTAQLKAENLNLKAKNIELQSFYNLHGNVDNYIDKLKAENDRLKAKLESVLATAYADSVDAGMRERRLQRALWLARALMASNKFQMFCFSSHIGDLMNVNGFIQRFKGCSNMRNVEEWQQIWKRVERKCIKKAEEYR